MSKIFELSIGELIVNEAGPTLDIFISLNDTDLEFDYHKFYNADESRYFTTQENVAGALDDVEERLCELSHADNTILATVLIGAFYPISSEIVESEE